MDALLLARIKFAVTIGFHFIFPSISIGLAWMVVVAEWLGWRKNDEHWARVGRLFGKLLVVTFAVGVATGIVMEFQFGTNWARYSRYVGDIFGAPLAIEAIFTFFLESAFVGLYVFGRGRVSKRLHWFSAFMVAVGATMSAFWIVVANSWQQTPAGYVVRNGRAELTSFAAAVFNPSTFHRYSHVMVACLTCGAFIVAGVAAWHLLRDHESPFARKAMKLGVVAGLCFALLALMPTGHTSAQQVARTQPEKLAAIEGLIDGRAQAPLVVFGVPVTHPPKILAKLEIPGMLSWMAYGDAHAPVKGLNDFPPENRPPLWWTFVPFHNMVALGGWFIMVMLLAAFRLWRGKLWTDRWLLRAIMFSIPLPVAACQLGWMTAEVGRQPWVVYKLLRTADAHSTTVSAGEIALALGLFILIYGGLLALWLFLMFKKAKQGGADGAAPAPAQAGVA
jgi:cytochrome bd ubiquinol oxidase subunit I